jgi:hypothetical protein
MQYSNINYSILDNMTELSCIKFLYLKVYSKKLLT